MLKYFVLYSSESNLKVSEGLQHTLADCEEISFSEQGVYICIYSLKKIVEMIYVKENCQTSHFDCNF